MESLFSFLTELLYGNIYLAMIASFAWGVNSVILSPCHLTSIPLIIGFIASHNMKKVSGAFLLAFVFAVGILITIAVLGIITGALGQILGDIGPYGKYFVSVILVISGLYLMDIIRIPASGTNFLRPPGSASPLSSAFILGLIYGIALGPCAFAFLAPVLGIVFQLSSTNLLSAGTLLLLFGLGHCAVIIVAGGLTARIQAYLDWTNQSKAIIWIKRTAGFLIILGGIYNLYTS